jgi:LCP family protein required for cell wall assembly
VGGKRRRPKAPRWARALVWVGAVLVVLSAGSVAGTQVLVHRYTGTVHKASLLGSGARRAEPANHATITGPLNYLLLGSDVRPQPDNPGRSDTIIILHVAADHQSAYLVSIPRDLYVHIDKCVYSESGCMDKINAGYAWGGAQLESTTVTEVTGVHFDGMAIIDFSGFGKVVDALGGVTMNVDETTPSQFDDNVVYTVGTHHFTGRQALDYCRQREEIPDGDYGRQRHQQQLLKALVAGAADSVTDPVKLDRVIRAAGSDLTVDLGGVSLADLAFTLRGIRSDNLTTLRIPEIDLKQDGTSYQQLGDVGQSLFAATAADGLADWATQHPDMVNH